MCIRTILYGYEMTDGKLAICQSEASVVREVYDRYIAGETFQKIADSLTERGVTYFMGSKVWNKNHIARMIGDKRYAGEDHYPPIITADINDEALMIKVRRSSTKAELPGITKLIKSKLYCSVCGKHYNRKNKWKMREKWLCSGGCKCGVYLDDKTIFDGIRYAIEKAIRQKQTTTYQGQASYQPTMEITRRNNEIRRMMEQPKFNFKVVADAIMECASEKYACCEILCHTELTEEILAAYIKTTVLDEKLIERTIDKIYVDADGKITIRLISGATI